MPTGSLPVRARPARPVWPSGNVGVTRRVAARSCVSSLPSRPAIREFQRIVEAVAVIVPRPRADRTRSAHVPDPRALSLLRRRRRRWQSGSSVSSPMPSATGWSARGHRGSASPTGASWLVWPRWRAVAAPAIARRPPRQVAGVPRAPAAALARRCRRARPRRGGTVRPPRHPQAGGAGGTAGSRCARPVRTCGRDRGADGGRPATNVRPGTEDPPPGRAMTHHFETPVHHLDCVVFVGKRLAEGSSARCVRTGGSAPNCRSPRRPTMANGVNGSGPVAPGSTLRPWSSASAGSSTAGRVPVARHCRVIRHVRRHVSRHVTRHVTRHAHDTSHDTGPADVVTAGIMSLRVEPLEVHADDGVQLGLWGGRTQARRVGTAGDGPARRARSVRSRCVVPAWRGGRQPSDDCTAGCRQGARDLADSVRVTPPPAGNSGGPWPGSAAGALAGSRPHRAVEVVVVDDAGAPVAGHRAWWGERSAEHPGRARVVTRRSSLGRTVGAGGAMVGCRRVRRAARFQLLTVSGRAYLAAGRASGSGGSWPSMPDRVTPTAQ